MSVALASSATDILKLARQHETKIRFIAAGGLNTLFGLAAFPVLMWTLASMSMHYLIILTIAQILSISFSFITNKFLVFRTSGNYLAEFGKFITFHAAYFIANLVALPIMVELLGVPPIWGQFGFAAAVIVSSYFWHSRITFQRRGS
ncbi:MULTISPECIES: GtrA family protein [Rhizobium]|uniref:GtrA family protein n=1 Tax=Rhizobium TaxID=379 RepID=UPI0009F536A7|nr:MULTISPECIES: GtrA family protein [Rhizobium]NTF45747.1 GtrA family protein [Rhizobium rhizogenes]